MKSEAFLNYLIFPFKILKAIQRYFTICLPHSLLLNVLTSTRLINNPSHPTGNAAYKESPLDFHLMLYYIHYNNDFKTCLPNGRQTLTWKTMINTWRCWLRAFCLFWFLFLILSQHSYLCMCSVGYHFLFLSFTMSSCCSPPIFHLLLLFRLFLPSHNFGFFSLSNIFKRW